MVHGFSCGWTISMLSARTRTLGSTYAPADNSNLNSVNQKWAARVTWTLPFPAVRDSATDVGVMDCGPVQLGAIKVGIDLKPRFLQMRHQNSAGSVQPPSGQNGRRSSREISSTERQSDHEAFKPNLDRLAESNESDVVLVIVVRVVVFVPNNLRNVNDGRAISANDCRAVLDCVDSGGVMQAVRSRQHPLGVQDCATAMVCFDFPNRHHVRMPADIAVGAVDHFRGFFQRRSQTGCW